jgi:cysteinyl-tRNA synthetase
MELRLYDTLTREKRVFVPIDPVRVRMYVCGPTVYDFAHIGNARPVIVFDVLFRLLRHLAKQGVWDGGKGETEVVYVRNVTDVDDKINARAAERGISIRELTKTTYDNFKSDVAALGCLEPTVEPRATEYVSKPAASVDMIRLIERLIANGNAYVAEGHVLFAVSTMLDYGKLSKRSLDEMVAGARVEVAPYKRDPMDFVLWKPSPPELPGWDSPWGRGRPGWHIECSAMSAALLGETFDIHGGGIDLVFPHHENEIAQSRCAFHTPVMASYWMHNGFVQVEGKKMAKSEGNFVTVHDLLHDWHGRAWPGAAVRWAMLQIHYRDPFDWTLSQLERCAEELLGILNVLRGYFRVGGKVDFDGIWSALKSVEPSRQLLESLCDDLNTSRAITGIRAAKIARTCESTVQIVKDLMFLGVLKDTDILYYSTSHGTDSSIADREGAISIANDYQMARANGDVSFANTIIGRAKNVGLNIVESEPSLLVVSAGTSAEAFKQQVGSLIAQRDLARRAKNFKESDRIRDELAAMGVVLKDSKDGTTWEIAR